MHYLKENLENALISIIVPVYNSSAYLNKCLKSIQNQSFTNFEVVLVNDGSTDNSLDICKFIAQTDKRFKVFTQNDIGSIALGKKSITSFCGRIEFITAKAFIYKSIIIYFSLKILISFYFNFINPSIPLNK